MLVLHYIVSGSVLYSYSGRLVPGSIAKRALSLFVIYLPKEKHKELYRRLYCRPMQGSCDWIVFHVSALCIKHVISRCVDLSICDTTVSLLINLII